MKHVSIRCKFNIITVLVFSICLILVLLGSDNIKDIENNTKTLEENLEYHWREQARLSINNIITQLDMDYRDGLVDIYNNSSLETWADIRFNDVKNGSSNSDGWIAELDSGKYIFTQDTMINRNKIIITCYTDKSQYNMDNESLNKVFSRIQHGVPSQYGENIKFITEEGYIWIEFSYYPIDKIIDKGEKSDKRIIIAIETKSDEIYERYNTYFEQQDMIIHHTYVMLYAAVILGIILLTTIFIRHKD